MEIVKLTEDKHAEWNKFCLESDDAWFWHTTDWQDYILSYISESRPEKENLSFMVYKNDEVVAVVPLVLEKVKFGKSFVNEFAFDGWRTPVPAFSNNLKEIKKEDAYKIVFAEIDRLGKENKIVKVRLGMDFLAPGSQKKTQFNYLMKFGYLDISLNTQIINLKKSEEDLWRELRRNHRRNILKGDKFKVIFYTRENISEEIFNKYKETHHKAAGRKTRSDETFELMFDWIRGGIAFLAGVEFEGKVIGFEYYSIYKNNVYGFSAANDPDFGHLPIRHFLEWQGILWMKQQGFNFYEIGLQQYGNSLYDFPSEKQINISHFKKGFGGFTVPIFMGEKYFNKNYFLEVYQEKIKKFAEKL